MQLNYNVLIFTHFYAMVIFKRIPLSSNDVSVHFIPEFKVCSHSAIASAISLLQLMSCMAFYVSIHTVWL